MPIDAVPLDVGALPGIVCGPILRRLTRTQVSIWVATVAPDPITLTRARGRRSGRRRPVTATPARVGSHLWMTVLTADAPGGTVRRRPDLRVRADGAVGGDPRPIPWADLVAARRRPGRRSSRRPTTVGDLVV